jgi:hypothetical protein
MIASAINERMQRKLDYTREEVRVLKELLQLVTGSGRFPSRPTNGVVSRWRARS